MAIVKWFVTTSVRAQVTEVDPARLDAFLRFLLDSGADIVEVR